MHMGWNLRYNAHGMESYRGGLIDAARRDQTGPWGCLSARPGRVCGVAARMSGCAAAPHGEVIHPINLTTSQRYDGMQLEDRVNLQARLTKTLQSFFHSTLTVR